RQDPRFEHHTHHGWTRRVGRRVGRSQQWPTRHGCRHLPEVMSARPLLLLALAALLLVAVAPDTEAKSGTPITTCGQVVTTSAFLTRSLLCPNVSGVVVGADGITIDLEGFTLRGGGIHYGVDDPGYDRVTVENGVLRSFDVGLYAHDGA